MQNAKILDFKSEINFYNASLRQPLPVGKIAKKSAFLLIGHSKYQKYTPIGCFFGDFAHWDTSSISAVSYQ